MRKGWLECNELVVCERGLYSLFPVKINFPMAFTLTLSFSSDPFVIATPPFLSLPRSSHWIHVTQSSSFGYGVGNDCGGWRGSVLRSAVVPVKKICSFLAFILLFIFPPRWLRLIFFFIIISHFRDWPPGIPSNLKMKQIPRFQKTQIECYICEKEI